MENAEEIVDLRGIAALLGVSKHTPNQWRQRGVLPDPDFPALLRPVWKVSTIIQWARSTGRWPPGEAARPEARSHPVNVNDEPNKPRGFRTSEDRAAEIPQAVFRPAEPVAA